jgi:Spy/CpxP family protein refolding chaperone
MKEIYLSEKIDRTAIEKAIKQVSDLQQQVKMNFVDFWFSVNGVLTPDQQKVWKRHVGGMMGEMRGRLRERMHRGGPMMPHPPDDEDPE